MILFGLGEIIAIVVGLALGALLRLETRRPVDYVGNGLSLILYSMPYFLIGMILLVIFAVEPRLVPDVGDVDARRAVRVAARPAPRLRPPPRPAAGDRRPRPHRPVLDPHALVGHRDARRGLRHDGSGEGPRRAAGSCARTPSPTRCCRRSRSSRSTSATSSPARSPSRSCSTGRASGTLTVDALTARDYPVLQGIFLLLCDHRRPGQPRRRPRLRQPRPAGRA